MKNKITLNRLQKSAAAIQKSLAKKLIFFRTYSEYGQDFAIYIDKDGNTYELPFEMEDEKPLPNFCESNELEPSGDKVNPEEFEELVRRTSFYVLADSLAKKGYSHREILWALFRPEEVPEGWSPTKEKPDPKTRTYLDSLKEKMELIKFQRWALNVLSKEKGILREITFVNHEGVHGYKDYDFNKLEMTGYTVTCWKSYAFGGNCNCNNHKPGHSLYWKFSYQDIPLLKAKVLKHLQSKEIPQA